MSGSSVPERTVLVGVDGRASSIDALRWGARLAEAFGGQLRAVTAWTYQQRLDYRSEDWSPQLEAGKKLAAAVRTAFPDGPPDCLQTQTVEGSPLVVLTAEAQRCRAEALVLGISARRPVSGSHGRLTAALLESAICPVVSVPHARGRDQLRPAVAGLTADR